MRKPLMLALTIGLAAVLGAGAWWVQTRPMAPKEAPGAKAASAGGGAGGGGPSAARVPGVEAAKVVARSLQDDAQAVGTLRSRQSVVLRPEVAGRIRALGFVDGAAVRKGQVLVQLDDTLQRAEVAQARAQESIAQANLRRNQELVAQQFVAQRVVDESLANLQVVQAQLALAEARLARMAIVAPFDGVLGLRSVNVGDYVKDGADLVNLEDLGRMLVDFRLPERYLRKIRVGQRVELTLDAWPGRAFEARVEALDPLLDANGRSVAVRASLPNSEGRPLVSGTTPPGAGRPGAAPGPLRAGMFARVTAIFGVNADALVVPEEAIQPQAGRQYVYRLKPAAPAPKEGDAQPAAAPAGGGADAAPQWSAHRQEVTLGVRREGKVEIVSGLQEGDMVVTAGQQRLQKDGALVRIVQPGGPAGRAPAKGPEAAASAPQAPASR